MISAIAKGNLAIIVSFTEAGMADTPTYMFASIDRRVINTIDIAILFDLRAKVLICSQIKPSIGNN